MPSTLVDSGPLVALFNRRDRHHAEALAFVEREKGELVTNIPVVVEVAFLLSNTRIALRLQRELTATLSAISRA